MDEVYVAQDDGTLVPVRLLNKQENASVKREKLLLSEGGGE
jgi:protease II